MGIAGVTSVVTEDASSFDDDEPPEHELNTTVSTATIASDDMRRRARLRGGMDGAVRRKTEDIARETTAPPRRCRCNASGASHLESAL